MIPISDENPTLRTPVMTWIILGAMFAVWFVVQGGGIPGTDLKLATSICNFGMIPGELTGRAVVGTGVPLGPDLACLVDHDPINYLTPIFSMFLHGSWLHILGNAMFFWVFGNNIEDSMGPGRFLTFYITCGLVAAGVDIAAQPASPIPTVGASGAIAGVLGAYLVLYPKVRVNMLFIFVIFFKVFAIPAWLVLIYWFGLQVLAVNWGGGPTEMSGGVAVWAHIGGFLAGMVLVKLFENPRLVERRNAIREQRQYELSPR
ncbi:MAG: rhomboid family intramembrane serine protease [Gemmatimonadaceae bacterium]